MAIVEVIKYEGDNNTFVWKHPGEDFNTFSQLIVHESQEALFFKDGKVLDVFGPGRYTLHTENIPIITSILKLGTGGVSPFHCEVYFVNKAEQMAINWGMGDVNFIDSTHNNYVFKIGASGKMSVKVNDAKKLITKLVGAEDVFNQETLKKYFKAPIITCIKTLLPRLLNESNISIFEIESNLSELSDILKEKISLEMDDYGITLVKFWINTIVKPEDDPFYNTIIRQRGEKITIANQGNLDAMTAENLRKVSIIEHSAIAQNQRMDIDTKKYEYEELGYSYQDERRFNVLEGIANNEGAGADVRNTLMGVGMGYGVGGVLSSAMNNIANEAMHQNYDTNANKGSSQEVNKNDVPEMLSLKDEFENDDISSFKNRLEKLKLMKDTGVISDEEFEKIKNEIISKIKG